MAQVIDIQAEPIRTWSTKNNTSYFAFLLLQKTSNSSYRV